MEVKVDLFARKSEKHPELVGFANLTVGGIKIENVAIKQTVGKMGKKEYNFQVPSRNTGLKDEQGKDKYVKCFEISPKQENAADGGKLVNGIRKAIEAAVKTEPNEYKAQSATVEVDIPYDQDHITSYVNLASSEKDEHLRGFASIYVGSILRINDVALKEFENKETHEPFASINFPSRDTGKVENGMPKYEENVYPIVKGMRQNMVDACVNAWSYENNMAKKQEQEKEKSQGEEM